jgi:hypothetical protein
MRGAVSNTMLTTDNIPHDRPVGYPGEYRRLLDAMFINRSEDLPIYIAEKNMFYPINRNLQEEGTFANTCCPSDNCIQNGSYTTGCQDLNLLSSQTFDFDEDHASVERLQQATHACQSDMCGKTLAFTIWLHQ